MASAWEVVQESTGFSPNESDFGHTVGPLTLLHDAVTPSEARGNLVESESGIICAQLDCWLKICFHLPKKK